VAFRIPDVMEALPEVPLWEQDWVITAAKQLVAVLAVLFLIFGVLRPTMRGLVSRDEEVKALMEAHAQADASGGTVRLDADGKPVAVPAEEGGTEISQGAEDLLLLEAPQSYEKRLEYVQKLIDEDPQLVSQMMTGWLKTNG
jgi:flagellar M-ring protein FliF